MNAVSTNLREKNSPLNTFFAGAASGLVLGAASKYMEIGLVNGILTCC